MTVHSKIGASSMHRWAECPGSVRLSEHIVSRTSVYAEEGTAAHDLGARLLLGQANLDSIDDEELKDALKVYYDEVNKKKRTSYFVEQSFDLSAIYPGLYGTADCILWFEKEKRLQVIDYKHGMGIPVEIIEHGKPNPQLMYYALGALMHSEYPADTVEITIVQPRCPHPDGPVRSHVLPAMDLLEFAADLVDYAKKTEDPNAPLNPGDWCRFCPAAATCPELHKNAVAIAKEEFSPVLSYDPPKLAKVLDWLPILEAWIKNVREFAYAESQHGRTPPGWKLVAKRASRKWRDDVDATSIMGALDYSLDYDLDQFMEKKLKSPAQMEKLMITKEDKERLASLIVAESSGVTLAREADKRPAVKMDAKSEFAAITEGDE